MRPTYEQDGNQALPFSSCYAPPFNSRPAAVASAAAPVTGAAAQTGVCIVRKVEGAVQVPFDCTALQSCGFKLRPSTSCIPDLIITAPSLQAPLAIMLVATTDPHDSLDSTAFMQRCSSMASTFRTCCVMLPHALGAHPAVLQLASDAKYKGKVQLEYLCPGDDPAHKLLQITTYSSNSPQVQQLAADAWDEVVAIALMPEAIDACWSAVAGGAD